MRRKLVVGNWKMNGSLAANAALLDALLQAQGTWNCDVAVCAPGISCRQQITGMT